MAKAFHISGHVIDRKTRQGLAGLRIEPWDKALLITKSLGSAVTDPKGAFSIDLDKSDLKTLFANRPIVLFFKVFRDTEFIAGTENSVVWDQDSPDKEVSIEINAPRPEQSVVKGQVHKTKDVLLTNSPIRVFGTALGREKLLAETKTDDAGRYEVTYSPGEFAANIDANARIIVRAFDNQANPVAASPAFVASPEQNMDITVSTALPEQYSIRGLVRDKTSKPISDSVVRLFGRNLASGNERLLGQVITDLDGSYLIQYDPAEFKSNVVDTNRLVVRVFDKLGRLLDPTSPLFRAQPEESVNITITSELPLSEYEKYLQQLTPILQNKLIADVSDGDVSALSGQTGIARQHIESLRGGAQLSRQTGLATEVFYGFARQGLPLVLESLLAHSLDELRATLLAAIAGNIIPARLRDLLDGIMARLDELKRSQPPFDPKDLEACRHQLNEVRQALATAEQNQILLRRALQEREQLIKDQQSLISELQRRINNLEEIIRETGQRAAVEPKRLGTALGETVDAIQQGLTNLQNQFVDYGLQELDVHTQVNLQVSSDGHLLMRFPGLNEEVAPQNLSQLQLRLRPIPKSQRDQSENSKAGPQTSGP